MSARGGAKKKKKEQRSPGSIVKKLGKIYRKGKKEEEAKEEEKVQGEVSARTSVEDVVVEEEEVSEGRPSVEGEETRAGEDEPPSQDVEDSPGTDAPDQPDQEQPDEQLVLAGIQEKLRSLQDTMPQVGQTGEDKRECLYKILVIGELGTGKTSIIKRYVHQFFSQHYRATIGVDFALKIINWDSNTIIRLQLWDIAGQERFGNMTRVYYKEAVGAFIVFDVTRVGTFDAVLKWKQDLDNKVQLPDGGPIPCVLLANKCDQQKEGLVNQPAKMDDYCKENQFSGWFETSAKENINIEEAAKTLVSQILRNDLLNDPLRGAAGSRDNGKFPLQPSSCDSSSERKTCTC